uniref:Pre-mRNA splicing Prp18-interacting factor n=1 Tax=Tanacetum cinerariifolium TaxID=118510 RepID=A0A6L2NV42_TANCI|nr:hypothetical protein [Tanacetum cinerariifolium]
MSSFYEFICYGCGGPSDTPLCYLCAYEQCGNILIDGTCSKCNSGTGNSFAYDPIPKSFNEVQSIFNPHPQSHYKIYLCQLCESNSHYGYECSQRVPLVYEPEPCYNQNFGDNDYPHDLLGVTPLIDHHCCYKCRDSLDSFFCHQCTCEFCGNGAHDGYNCPSHVSFIQTLPSFPQQYLCCENCGGPHETFQSTAITFDLPTVEPEDSLRMGDEHLDTIPKTESDEFIKSSVENLVPNPRESEDLSASECDVPVCDDFTTFSNLLFDADDDFSSNLHHFNVESDLIESLLNQDSSIISFSSKIDSFLDEFIGEFILLKSIPPGIGETDYDPEEEIRLIEKLLYDNSSPRPPEEFISENSDDAIKSFSLSPIPEEIRLIEKLLYDNSSPRPPEEFISENSDDAIKSFSLSPIPVEDSDLFMEEIDLFLASDGSITPVSVGCQKPGHLAARLGCAETKVATWDDLAFKLITLGWNVKHKFFLQIVDPWLKFESSTFTLIIIIAGSKKCTTYKY